MADVSLAPPWAALLVPPVLLALTAAAATGQAVVTGGRRHVSGPVRLAVRLTLQGRRTTLVPDGLLWRLGTGTPLVLAALLLSLVPFGTEFVADPPVGVVWLNALDTTLWAGWWLSGWGANSLQPLVGGYRLLAQALSYELPLMFSLTAPAIAAHSLRVSDVVAAQRHGWFVLQMPVALVLYLVGVAGYSTWGPMSYPLGRDLSGGVSSELSGVDRLVLHSGRVALLAAGSAMAVPLFLGGGAGPVLPAAVWSIAKTGLVLAAVLLVADRLPAARPERFASFGWLVLLPLSLAQALLVTVLAVSRA